MLDESKVHLNAMLLSIITNNTICDVILQSSTLKPYEAVMNCTNDQARKRVGGSAQLGRDSHQSKAYWFIRLICTYYNIITIYIIITTRYVFNTIIILYTTLWKFMTQTLETLNPKPQFLMNVIYCTNDESGQECAGWICTSWQRLVSSRASSNTAFFKETSRQ